MLKSIQEYINNPERIYAHIKEGKQAETLEEHLNRTIKYYHKMAEKKDISKHIKKLIEETFNFDRIKTEEKEYIYQLFINAIYLHDLGKINPKFQKDKMKNYQYKEIETCTSEHSLPSSFMYIDIFSEETENFKNKKLIKTILYCFAYQIARHHSNLEDLSAEEFLNKLEKIREEKLYKEYKNKDRLLQINLEENIFLEKNKTLKKYQVKELEFFILNKLLYSLIITCDYYATYEYMNLEEVEIETLNSIEELFEKYKNTSVYQSIDRYKRDKNNLKENDINRLRTDIFIESEEILKKNLDKNLFYLEAPTGSGKTNTSINLALNILENNRSIKNIFYIFPFNTLIEQTKETFEKIFTYEKDFICINSSIAITQMKEEENIDYEKLYLDYSFMHYPIILTSHVNLFSSLFGIKKESNLLLSRFSNSVIIIDEIQAYKNSIWKEIINFLERYSKILNIKIIIMSATLPKLDKLIYEDKQVVNLIQNKKKYFQNPIFCNRVKIDTQYLENKMDLESLANIIKGREEKQEKILIEFIKKRDARDFYKLLRDKRLKKEIVEISGDDNKYIRKQVLEKIRETDDIIVVCTQVIEAGVDIDMDIGFKDISLIESEEQFLGRINRSCKKQNCKAYFFDYTPAHEIYRNDIRNGYNIKDKKYKRMLEEKDFEQYYQEVLKEVNNKGEEYNQNNFNRFLEDAQTLQFEKIDKKMKLINQMNLQLFLNQIITIDNKKIIGSQVWEEYKQICLNSELNYARRKIELSKIHEIMDLFIYSITIYDKDNCKKYYTEEFGDILYIENGENFIEEGKFSKERYDKKCGDIFW